MFFILQMKVAKFFLIICAAMLLSAFFCGCTAASEKRTATLAGTCWAPESGPQGAVLEFTADGRRIVGTTNGNRFFGPVDKMERNILHFGDIAVTRAMAREPHKERIFLDGLNAARAWSFDGNILVLEDERRKPVLRLLPLERGPKTFR